jgi:hypothetical protein
MKLDPLSSQDEYTSQALDSGLSHTPPPASILLGETFVDRTELIFSGARSVIVRHGKTSLNERHPLLGQTMSFDDLRAMTQQNPSVLRLIDHMHDQLVRILEEFDLPDYHVIAQSKRLVGRADDSLERRDLSLATGGLRTDPGSRIVLHPATWTKLDILAREFYERFGEPVTIASGYRSDAYQLYLLAYNASRIDDPENPGRKLEGIRPLHDVFRTVAPPGCSEHSMRVPAFDVRNWMDRPSDLRDTEMWRWFHDRAVELGIVESYPLGSINASYGEPWHFRDE